MLIDSHCHLDRLVLKKYDGKLEKALEAAKTNDVDHILNVCISLENFPQVLEIAEKHAGISATVGVHPSEWGWREPSVDELIQLSQHEKVVAIGETGLDYHHNPEKKKEQCWRFRTHIEAAVQAGKPLVVHGREAYTDIIKIIKEEGAGKVNGVMHCFSDTVATAKKVLDLGFYIGISGVVTFKNADEVRKVVKMVPLDRLLIETDAPYLAPVPYRGKPNEPAYVKLTAEFIAKLRNIDYEELAQATTDNFFKLFAIKKSSE
jgi:TatD DNase family protein